MTHMIPFLLSVVMALERANGYVEGKSFIMQKVLGCLYCG